MAVVATDDARARISPKVPAFTSRVSVTTLKLLSRHSCQTGERRAVPSRRYVARMGDERQP
jgi:hypothetical protein